MTLIPLLSSYGFIAALTLLVDLILRTHQGLLSAQNEQKLLSFTVLLHRPSTDAPKRQLQCSSVLLLTTFTCMSTIHLLNTNSSVKCSLFYMYINVIYPWCDLQSSDWLCRFDVTYNNKCVGRYST